jgi:hypothetical protein
MLEHEGLNLASQLFLLTYSIAYGNTTDQTQEIGNWM